MTDSIDKKSNEKRDNLDVDLDALLDEAEYSLVPMNAFQDDEDAIDRLLLNASFDADDMLMQTELSKDIGGVKDVDLHDDLDGFLGFDGFGGDFNEPKKNQAVEINEPQDDEDAIGRLLMGVGFDADDAPVQSFVEEKVSAIEELDDFSDFSDFNEPETVPVVEIDNAGLADEADDFSGFDVDFDETDLILDDEVEASAATNLIAPAVDEGAEEDAGGEVEDLDGFSDYSDFNEPEIIPAVATDESEQATENSTSDAGLSDEVDDFSGFDDDFDSSDLIQDDGVAIPASADLGAPNEEPQAIVEQSFDDENAIDNLSLEAGFDTEDALEQTGGKADELVADADLSNEVDDFDISDLIQDDEVETSANLDASNEEPQAVVEQPSDDEVLLDAGLSDDVDDFSGFGDDFDISDLIQDDEVEASADLVAANEEQQTIAEGSFNDLQDDENSFNSLFADAGVDAGDPLEQTAGKKDEFVDDADSSEIDDFFQLAEVSDDFSTEVGEDQLAETETSSTQDFQDDDFLLPDFDITADSEISDTGIKEDELADPFGDTDFLSEDEVMQAFEPETSELKSEGNEAVADTAIEGVDDVKLSPFEFEQGDIKKQLEEAENKVKKAKLFSYVALGFGVVALSTAAGLGIMTYSAKTEVSKLTETVSTLEASLAKSAADNPNEEINAMMNSVVQLNQQVYGFITELKGNSQFPVDLLNNNVSNIVAKQDMVSKALDILQVKMGGSEGKISSVSFTAEPPKVEAVLEPLKVEPAHELAPVKAEAAHAPTKEGVAAHEVAPTKERAINETASAKVEATHEVAPAKVKIQPEAVTAKPVIAAKAVVKEEPVKVKIEAAPGKWGVNLVAFKQEWFAKSKAAEFAQQGIFAEVIPVNEKNATMYRLRVGGFKSKADANSNTARIKKALNLDSVWVSDN